MTLAGFIMRNALRNKRRFVLTLSSVALSLFLLTVLQVVLRGLTDPATNEDVALRIVTRHKVSLANMLFSKYRQKIESMPGVAACTKLLWFGGIYRDEKNFFPQFACDAETLFKVMTEAKIDPQQHKDFAQERAACVVGKKTFERFGWKLGERITLMGAMWPCDVELTVRGVYTGFDETNLYFHHEYFDELLGDKGFTGLFWIRANSPAAASTLIDRIDGEFQNSDAETKTETEQAFKLGFVSMFGNVKTFIRSISIVILATLLLVTACTMSMAVRERVREIGILKALGFGRSQVFGFILAESFALAMAGGIIGCASAWLLLGLVDIYKVSRGMFVSFEVTPQILALALLTAAALGVLSCLLPAATALRRSVVDAVRTVD